MRAEVANKVLEILGSGYRVNPYEQMDKGIEEIFAAIPGYIQREVAKALEGKEPESGHSVVVTRIPISAYCEPAGESPSRFNTTNIENMNG